MQSGPLALILFYGVFWNVVLSTVGRYRAFDTSAMYSPVKGRLAKARVIWSVLLINLAPVLLLWVLYQWLVPDKPGIVPVLVAATASLSVFSFHRVLHALIASDSRWRRFYTEAEWKNVMDAWCPPELEPVNTFRAHFLPGVLYLLVPIGVAGILRFLLK